MIDLIVNYELNYIIISTILDYVDEQSNVSVSDIRLLPSPNSPLTDGLTGNCVPIATGVTTMTIHINTTAFDATPSTVYHVTLLTTNIPCMHSFHVQIGLKIPGTCSRFRRCDREEFVMVTDEVSQCSFTCYCDGYGCGQMWMLRLSNLGKDQQSRIGNTNSALCWVTVENAHMYPDSPTVTASPPSA